MSHADDSEFDRRPEPPVERKTIRKFREQIHALGALWIILGAISLGLVAAIQYGGPEVPEHFKTDNDYFIYIIAGIGAVWMILGVLTCLKQMWAVYLALILSYLSLISNTINLNICGLVIVVIVILQAHRVINWSWQLKAAGVPLSTKP